MEDIIKFEDISVKFPGVLALDNVNFSIKKGEIHAIVGENGAGKTTLMNILIGEVQPSNGNIIYKGKPIMISDPQHALYIGIGIVYQERKLCPNLSIMENIFLGREEKNKFGLINRKEAKINSKKILEQFGLNVDVNTLVSNLTVGEQQVVEIVKAVSLDSNVLILDEPTSSLTFKESDTLFENIRKLKNEGVSIIFISHRLEEVFQIADRVSVLRNGKYLGTYDIDKIKVDDVITLKTRKGRVPRTSVRG